MTIEQLNKAVSILNKNNFLPNGLELHTRLRITDIKSCNYEYWGNKYTSDSEHHKNSVVALKFEHCMVEKPFWIIIFKGAQSKVSEVNEVSAFWELPDLADSIYANSGIMFQETNDGVETILDIVQKFEYLWFEEDEASECDPLIWNDSDLLYWLAEEIEKIFNIKINLSVPYELIKQHHILELEKALLDAKEALENNLLKEKKVRDLKKNITLEKLLIKSNLKSKFCDFNSKKVINLPETLDINKLDTLLQEKRSDVVILDNINYIVGIYSESASGYALWECKV